MWTLLMHSQTQFCSLDCDSYFFTSLSNGTCLPLMVLEMGVWPC